MQTQMVWVTIDWGFKDIKLLLTSPEERTLLRYSRKASSFISLSVKMKVMPCPSAPAVLYNTFRSSMKLFMLYVLMRKQRSVRNKSSVHPVYCPVRMNAVRQANFSVITLSVWSERCCIQLCMMLSESDSVSQILRLPQAERYHCQFEWFARSIGRKLK